MHDRDGNDADGSSAAELAAMAAGRFDARANVSPAPIVIDGFLCLPVCAGRAVIGAAILPDRPETQDRAVPADARPGSCVRGHCD